MKEVLILRHGKSDWHSGASSDHERPLNPRGRKAADKIGRFLNSSARAPDQIVSSTAVRARTTAERAVRAGGLDCSIELDGALYGASVANVLDACRKAGHDVERLLMPATSDSSSTVFQLTGARVRFPTAALACIALPITRWDEIDPSRGISGELHWFVIPRLLRG